MTALRLGLLSTARINGAILRGAAATDRVDVTAVASRDGATAQAYASEHGLERGHGSYEALLEDAEVDAVYISLPNGMHHEWTMRALEAGKHVLCEKPYSRHPAEVEEAFDAAAAAGRVLTEAFMYRHHPQTAKARALVEDGAIGPLRLLRASFSFPLDDATNVRLRPELDGGALMDVGCYCVSGLRLLGGEPERVVGEQVLSETGVDATMFGTLSFAGGLVGPVRRLVRDAEPPAARGGGRGRDARARGALARGSRRTHAPRRGAGRRARGGLVPLRARRPRGCRRR